MRVFVTGASGFIGTAVVQELQKAGHQVTRVGVQLYAADSEQAGLLARQQEIENLGKQLRAQALLADEAKSSAVRAEAAYSQAAQSLTEVRGRAERATQRVHALQMDVLKLTQAYERYNARSTQIDEELSEIAAQIEEQVALRAKRSVAFFSFEMKPEELGKRMLANLAGVIGALLLPQWIDAEAAPWLFTAAFVGLMLGVGLLGGMINGIIIARFNLTPILTTLGTQLVFTGIATVLSNGSSVNLPYIEPLSAIGNDNFLGIPIAFYLFVAVVLFLGWLLRRTPFGLRLYMQGTNPKAAFYAGISRNTMLVCTYTMCGLLAACSGLISASQAASASAKYGDSYLLIAILIAVMGGVNPAGGYGRVICVFFAATALQLLSSMFNLLGLSEFAGNCIWGLLLLFFLAYSRQELKLKIKRREPVKA